MKSTNFETYLCSNLNITQQESSSIIKNCKTKTISKDQFLLRENEHCKQTFFVEQGLLRMFSLDKKGKEHILTFASENWFLTDRESSYFNQPSAYYIQALEDSQAVMIDEDFIQRLSKEIPNFTDFNNRLLHNHIRHLQNRIHLLLSATAKDRYLQFIAMYPDILLRVPQSMIASYLGITPESLSRVRKEISQNNN